MKKLISFITAAVTAFTAFGFTAVADGGSVTGYAVDNGVYIEYKGGKKAVLTVYDGDSLVYSNSADKETGGYFFSVPDEYANGRIRMYCVGIGIFDVSLEEYDAVSSATSEEKTPAAEPTATAEPTAAATETPARTPIPEVYDGNLDALNAPAVIESVSERIMDGETYYVTTMLYQGVEITTNIRDWVKIDSAPSRYSDLNGQTAKVLKEGDVIHFTNNLQHQIKSIDLIYRPDFDNYVESGGDYGSKYSKLIGKDKYSTFVFGVPVQTGKGYVLLADVNGKTTEVDVSTKAFIYTVSRRSRNGKCELRGTGASAIDKVYVQNTNLDNNDNVVSWDDVDVISYALARIVNGTATEVIVFEY